MRLRQGFESLRRQVERSERGVGAADAVDVVDASRDRQAVLFLAFDGDEEGVVDTAWRAIAANEASEGGSTPVKAEQTLRNLRIRPFREGEEARYSGRTYCFSVISLVGGAGLELATFGL
jgi:hypothetical protein